MMILHTTACVHCEATHVPLRIGIDKAGRTSSVCVDGTACRLRASHLAWFRSSGQRALDRRKSAP